MIRKNLMGIPVQYCPDLRTVLQRGAPTTKQESKVWDIKLPDRRWNPAWGPSDDQWRIDMTLVNFEDEITREDLATFARANKSRYSYPRECAELAREDPWLSQELERRSIAIMATKPCPVHEEDEGVVDGTCLVGVRFAPPDHRILYPYHYEVWPKGYWFLFVDAHHTGPQRPTDLEPVAPRLPREKRAKPLPLFGQLPLDFDDES